MFANYTKTCDHTLHIILGIGAVSYKEERAQSLRSASQSVHLQSPHWQHSKCWYESNYFYFISSNVVPQSISGLIH